MKTYYIVLQSKSHAFILERRFKEANIICDLTYLPRQIMNGPCNLGVRFTEMHLPEVTSILRNSGLPGCRVFAENITQNGCSYYEIII